MWFSVLTAGQSEGDDQPNDGHTLIPTQPNPCHDPVMTSEICVHVFHSQSVCAVDSS